MKEGRSPEAPPGPAQPGPLEVMLALERVRSREVADAMLDELCATVVAWGRWRRAAFVAAHPWGTALGTAGLSDDERTEVRRIVDTYGAEVRLDNRRRVLARFRLEPDVDAAFVPAEKRTPELPPFVLPGPAGRAAPGSRWEAGDELVLLPQAADGSSLGTLALAEPTGGRRPADAASREHVRIVLQLAALTGELVRARQRSKELARDEARRILSVVESLNAIADVQPLLDRLAEASASVAGYRVAVLSVHLSVGSMLGAHNLAPKERETFLASMAATPLERRLEKRDRIRAFAYPGTGVAYVPHDADLARSAAFSPSEVPAKGTWHPEDRLFVLVRGGAGKEIGVLSLDEPLDGNAPTPQTLGPLRLTERLLALGGNLLHNRLFDIDLKRSEEEFRSLVDGAPVGIYRHSDDFRVLSANPRFAEIFGYESAVALEADPGFFDLVEATSREAFAAAIVRDGEVRGMEAAARRRDGTPIRLRITARRHADRGFVQGVVEDVTEARRLEEHIQRAQRLEALGTLASGIAHDFNNLLAGILGYASLLRGRLGTEADLARMSKAIEDSALRAAALTRELLGVARSGPGKGSRADVRAALSECARVARETFDRRIEIDLDLPTNLPPVACDPGDLHRTVLNICINARDAMPEGGTLRLAACVDDAGPRSPSGGAKGPWVRVDVEDTGVGMPADVQQHIFEPFFTTKPREKGTGLGLYTAYKVVSAYDGTIEVDSRVGEGTRFHVFLHPLLAASAEAPPSEAEAPPPAVPGRRVLVVEDEELVRDLATHVMRADGLIVEEAVDGEQAVRMLEDSSRAYDLVLLDLVLPRIKGAEVFRRLRAVRPDLPVILSSGNVDDGLKDPALRAGVAGVLPKPYRPDALLVAVRTALSRAPGR